MIKVLPSSNPAKEENLVDYVKTIQSLGVEYLHCDVMDGIFVENKCLSLDTLKNVATETNILLDIHLMIDNPIKEIKKYIDLRPSIVTIHYEAPKSIKEIKKIAKLLHEKEILFGLSIKPNTPVSMLEPFVDIVDLILIMSVEPGKSGQKFEDSAIGRIKETKKLIGNKDIILEVDGGINLENYESVVKAGAKFLVMGKAFYASDNRQELLKKIDKHY